MKLELSNRVIATILASAVVVAAGIVVGLNMDLFFGRGTAEPTASPEIAVPGIDPNAQDYEEEKVGSSMPSISIPGWVTLTLPADTTDIASGIDFYNPEENDGYYLLTYQLCLAETGEVLYQSGQIPAGKHIQAISLNRPLEKGEYEAVLHVQPYSAQDPSLPLNNADIRLTLIVQ